MKRLASGLAIISLLAVCFVFAPQVFAQDANLAALAEAGVPSADIRLIIARLIRTVVSLLGIVLVIMIVYAGYLYMLSKGDPEKVKRAWGIIRSALIGLAIVLSSYVITTFVINALLRAAGIGQQTILDSSGLVEPLSGSLGIGIIQDHYPPRNAVEIPRNTKIIMTFKEPMYLDSIMEPDSYDLADDVPTGSINEDNIGIYRTADEISSSLSSSQVNVNFTADWKTFVFDPVELMGSPIESQNYSVFLSPDILKLQPDLVTTASAFPAPFDGGYEWTFRVSTVVDLTPPHVQSFIPGGDDPYARNILVQVHFNEAIDPTSATGVLNTTFDTSLNFQNIQVKNDSEDGVPVEGTYVISNGYRTVEFVTFDLCGVNACGGDIYCLPASSDFTLLVRAAPLSTDPPQAIFSSTGYEGVVDVAGNSLDGGGLRALEKDFVADGPPSPLDSLAIDNFWTTLSTTAEENTNPPEIEILSPAPNQPDVNVDQDIEITFSELMRISTLTNQNIGISADPYHEMWYSVGGENVSEATKTKAVVSHGLFLDYESDAVTPQYYYPVIGNSVTTAYQICFYPAYGPPGDCGVDSTQPSCCFGTPSSAASCLTPVSAD